MSAGSGLGRVARAEGGGEAAGRWRSLVSLEELGPSFEQGQVSAYLTHVWLKSQERTGGSARPEDCCILPRETAGHPAGSWRGVRAEGGG